MCPRAAQRGRLRTSKSAEPEMSSTVPAAEAAPDATAEHPHVGHGQVPPSFGERYRTALANPRLSRNLTTFQQSWREARGNVVSEVDFQALRAKLKAAKTEVVANLDEYLARFQAAAERAGATVHHAPDAAAANRIVREIAEGHGVKLIAKSKTMVSEEIDLNHDFATHGIEVVETDLGEWIIQL